MSRKMTPSMTAIVFFLGIFVAAPAMAQSSPGAFWGGDISEHHQRLYQLMKDMNQKMGQMTERMSRGDLSTEERKKLALEMGRMSAIMRRMSGLEARPAMKPAEWQRQMDEMRKQMDEMAR